MRRSTVKPVVSHLSAGHGVERSPDILGVIR